MNRPLPNFDAQRTAAKLYMARWKTLRANGVAPVVISKRRNPRHWQAWRDYYRAQQLWELLSLMDDGRADKTVPTRWPADFERPEIAPDRRVKD